MHTEKCLATVEACVFCVQFNCTLFSFVNAKPKVPRKNQYDFEGDIMSIVRKVYSALRTYPVYLKEFGVQVANTHAIEYFKNSTFGYSDYFIKRTSNYFIKELAPIIKDYTNHTHIASVPPKMDFKDKKPVFVCWWQGYDEMPAIVKICYNKICKVFCSKEYEVVLITEANYSTYIDFPEYITKKYNDGCICKAHYADILRWGLLAIYGGIWLDATDYLTFDKAKDIENDLQYPYFSQRFKDASECPNEPCRGLWCNFYLMGNHDEKTRIFQFVYDGLLYYWKKHNMALHYVFLDYIIWAGYQYIDDIHELIDNVPPNNKNIWKLSEKMNEKYEENKWNTILNDNQFYKLTYKANWNEYTENGELTNYGYFISLSKETQIYNKGTVSLS